MDFYMGNDIFSNICYTVVTRNCLKSLKAFTSVGKDVLVRIKF